MRVYRKLKYKQESVCACVYTHTQTHIDMKIKLPTVDRDYLRLELEGLIVLISPSL